MQHDPAPSHRPDLGASRSTPPLARARRPASVSRVSERLLARGPEALCAGDLLSILLGPGARRRRPQETAGLLLARFGDVRRLSAANAGELLATGILGRAAALRLAAAFALGREVHAARLAIGAPLRASREIFEAFHGRLRDLKKERFICVLLDGRNRVLREDVVSEGILTASLVHPREVFAPAIRESAGGLVLVHNHPSGDPEPSPEDVEITRRLCAVGDLVGIRVLDHVVVGDGCYVSFLERGLLPG